MICYGRPMKRFIFAILSISATSAQAENLAERLEQPASISIKSDKSALILERCIGVDISDFASPSVLRGEREALIFYAAGPANRLVMFVVSIIDQGPDRRIEVRSNPSFDERVVGAVQACAR